MKRRRRHPSIIPLSREHHEALQLAFRLHHPAPPGPITALTPASTPESRAADVLAFFTHRLVAHLRAEEELLFPVLRAHDGGDPARGALLDELIADHRRLEKLRDAVAAATGEAALAPALAAFADLLEFHVRREERELFEHAADAIPAADADALTRAIRSTLGAGS
jgi:hypothetical protein